MKTPFTQSFWVRDEVLCAGCYPGDLDPQRRDEKLGGLLDCGIVRIINLMDESEVGIGGRPFDPYQPGIAEMAGERGTTVEMLRLPIQDGRAPSAERMREILDMIDDSVARKSPTYVHCWGGHGRTGTVVCCHLIRHGLQSSVAISKLLEMRSVLPKNHHPFEGDQEAFIFSWQVGR